MVIVQTMEKEVVLMLMKVKKMPQQGLMGLGQETKKYPTTVDLKVRLKEETRRTNTSVTRKTKRRSTRATKAATVGKRDLQTRKRTGRPLPNSHIEEFVNRYMEAYVLPFSKKNLLQG
jgi:hypothetical protein